MKRIFAIAAMAATVAFASCNKDKEGRNPAEVQPAKLTIGVRGTDTRAAGTLLDNSDNAIVAFKAFAFQGETLKAVLTSADGSAVSETANITTAIDAIYVLTNANAIQLVQDIVPGVTKAEFLELDAFLFHGEALQLMTDGKLWASSAVRTLTPADFTGVDNEASITIEVAPIAARINVTVDDQRDNLGSAGAWALIGTQMLNVAGTSRFIAPGSYVAPFVWHSAYANSDNPSATIRNYLNDAYSASGHMFYALENDGSEHTTIVTLVASKDGGTTKRYFPVHFTLADAGYILERGKSYQVDFTLTGNALDDPGIITPEEPVVNAKLTVAVTTTPWSMVSISKTF